jgi:hypothetical protein
MRAGRYYRTSLRPAEFGESIVLTLCVERLSRNRRARSVDVCSHAGWNKFMPAARKRAL